ncbi:hypothetical protein BaRGS_00006370 [Batillaria attramentaria]|uniref:Uncharacterized protein n=1 Tax=Batillaria attramentaria TaxID=370345 RepID=A0ABD0LSR9_9CAEN
MTDDLSQRLIHDTAKGMPADTDTSFAVMDRRGSHLQLAKRDTVPRPPHSADLMVQFSGHTETYFDDRLVLLTL